jgi:hypothetical protein
MKSSMRILLLFLAAGPHCFAEDGNRFSGGIHSTTIGATSALTISPKIATEVFAEQVSGTIVLILSGEHIIASPDVVSDRSYHGEITPSLLSPLPYGHFLGGRLSFSASLVSFECLNDQNLDWTSRSVRCALWVTTVTFNRYLP